MSTNQEPNQSSNAWEVHQHLLLHASHSEAEEVSPEDGDDHHPALETQNIDQREDVPDLGRPASRSSSVISYDSLEERPCQNPNQPGGMTKPNSRLEKRKRGSRLPETIWMMEIWSCVIASACLAAIIGILLMHQGLPLPQWPLRITINSLVSVFTALFKMALTMPIAEGIGQFKWLWFSRPRELADIEHLDKASRGAWGSFLLLLSRVPRLNSIWLANLGAIITIAALAVDPFSQQIIQFQPCLSDVAEAMAQIPKTQTLEPGITSMSLKPRLTGSMQAAIYMGLLSPPTNSSATITATCQTGNCTFPSDAGATFSTLALCRICVNISDSITYETSEDDKQRHASIESGAAIDGLDVDFSSMAGSTSFPRSIFSFEALMSQDGANETTGFAVACGLDPCVKTFAANVTNGTYHETEISSETLLWSYHAGYTLARNKILRNGTWQPCETTSQNTSTNTFRINTTSMGLMSHVVNGVEYSVSTTNVPIHNVSATASLWYPDECVWWFGDLPGEAVGSYLGNLFNNKTLDTPYWSRDPSSAQGDLWLQNLYRNGTANMDTVNAYIDGLVWSMTANMRQTSADRDELRAVNGHMQALEACLKVRWVWLSLPASLLGLEITFLAAIAVLSRSKTHWRGDWKGSSLALLFHGLDGHPARGMEKDSTPPSGDLNDKNGMFNVAKEMKVQLRASEDSWRFFQVQ